MFRPPFKAKLSATLSTILTIQTVHCKITGSQNFAAVRQILQVVEANFEVWGLQARAEELIHSCIREILLIGHKQAFAWIDSWIDMTMEDVRKYEKSAHEQTNDKLGPTEPEAPLTPGSKFGTPSATPPATPSTPAAAVKSWFGW